MSAQDALSRQLRMWQGSGAERDTLSEYHLIVSSVARIGLALVDRQPECLQRLMPDSLREQLQSSEDWVVASFIQDGDVNALARVLHVNDSDVRPDLPSDEMLSEFVTQLRISIKRTQNRISATSGTTSDLPQLTNSHRESLQESARVLVSLLETIQDRHTRYFQNKLVERVDKLSDDQDQLLKRQATDSLSKFFKELRATEVKSSRMWFVLAAIIFTAASVSGLLSLGSPPIIKTEASPSALYLSLHTAVITLPLYGFATYAARISSNHRSTARWSATLCAQLESIGLYTKEMPNHEKRDAIWHSFGSQIFETESPTAGLQAEDKSDNPQEILNLLVKLLKS